MAQTRSLAFFGCLLILGARGQPLELTASADTSLDTLSSQTTYVAQPPIPRSPLPTDLVLSAPASEKSRYESKSSIITKAGDNEPFVVGKGATVTFLAGEEIRLTGEFKVLEGSEFRASISDIAISKLDNVAENLPIEFEFFQNYPNPFNPETVIRYSAPNSAGSFQVILKIFNLAGQDVATLVNTEQKPGRYEVKFNGRKLSSGIYFYRIVLIGDGGRLRFVDVKKMALLK